MVGIRFTEIDSVSVLIQDDVQGGGGDVGRFLKSDIYPIADDNIMYIRRTSDNTVIVSGYPNQWCEPSFPSIRELFIYINNIINDTTLDGVIYENTNFTADFNALLYTVDATFGNITVTLNASNNGDEVTIQKIDSTANTVTLQPVSGTINGDPNAILITQWDSFTVTFDGTNYTIT